VVRASLVLSAAATLEEEVSRRRNLAIISHPDAGKTTLTEKLLLYGGAIASAGAVKAKGEQRRATSDCACLRDSNRWCGPADRGIVRVPMSQSWRSSRSAASRSARRCSRTNVCAHGAATARALLLATAHSDVATRHARGTLPSMLTDKGKFVSILDTPGHQDFSEDT
jgi:hypothetical protein